MRFSEIGSFNENYLNKKNTTAVNGIFVMLIIFSHYSQYAMFDGTYDWPYLVFKDHIRQMVVATFLFYSGYGMMEAIRKKGAGYINKLPAKFFRLLVRIWIALGLFVIFNAVMGIEYPVRRILLSFTLWDAIGNSSWYIFDILALYVLIFVSFKISLLAGQKLAGPIGIILVTLLTAGLIFALIACGKDTWWYNTLMLLPFGMFYSENRERIESIVLKNSLIYSLAIVAALGVYFFTLVRRENTLLMYTIWGLAFMTLMVLFTMKTEIYNPVLEWLGQHVFSIYILQRLPMLLLNEMGYIGRHKYICLVISIAATIPLAVIFDSLTDKLLIRKKA